MHGLRASGLGYADRSLQGEVLRQRSKKVGSLGIGEAAGAATGQAAGGGGCSRQRNGSQEEIVGTVRDMAPLQLEPVGGKQAIRLWNEYVARYHPLGYRRPFAAHQRYFLVGRGERRLGCLLFAAAAWALAERDRWIGWSQQDRAQRLNWVVGNTRFLLFPWVQVRNLASKALSLAVQRIRSDWQQRYGYAPVLLETFVEVGRYRGTCYQAANWIRQGLTRGEGRMGRHSPYRSVPSDLCVSLGRGLSIFFTGEERCISPAVRSDGEKS